MKWLAECSVAAFREALQAVAPELSGCPVTLPVPDPAAKADPLWWSSSAALGDRFVAKFTWSRLAALRLANEIGVLTALAAAPTVPYLPEVVATSTDPLLLITRRVPGASLFEVADSIDPDRAGRPPDTTRVGRGPGHSLHRTRHRPRIDRKGPLTSMRSKRLELPACGDLNHGPLLYQFWPGRWLAGQGCAIPGAVAGSGGPVCGGVAVTSAVSDHLLRRIGQTVQRYLAVAAASGVVP
jgi:hypothetical protein